MLYAADSVCICVAGTYSFGNLFLHLIVSRKKSADTSFILGIRSAPFAFSFIAIKSFICPSFFIPNYALGQMAKQRAG